MSLFSNDFLPSQTLAADAPEGTAWAHQSSHFRLHAVEVASEEAVAHALGKDATAQRVLAKQLQPQEGQVVGVRLNLNIAKSTGVLVHTLHQGSKSDGYKRGRGLWNGSVIGYSEFVGLRNAFFNVSQKGREAIAAGLEAKFPMASIDGTWVDVGRSSKVVEVLGVEVSFNPKRVHLFVDPEGRAIRSAEEVVIVGHRAYARGRLEYFTESTAPARAGAAPSAAVFASKAS